MAPQPQSQDITRATLRVLCIAGLIVACFLILRPFLTAIAWAATIVIATWPIMLRIQARLFGKRALAVLAMTVLLILIGLIPLSLAIGSIVSWANDIVAGVRSLATLSIPPLPAWAERLPLVGPKLAARWQQVVTADRDVLVARLAPYARMAVRWLLAEAGSVALIVVEFLLTVVISAVLYAKGEQAAGGIRQFARRLAGQYGENAAILAARTVRGVALGIVVTALIQTLVGGLGLAVSGVPAVALLMAIMFMLCVAQAGPGLVLVPATIWLFWTGQTLWGAVMVVWTIVVGAIAKVVRPLLIKKGADLPLLLIFAGVIGGLLAFGVIGLFIGPVLLAVTYTLLQAWVAGVDGPRPVAGEPNQ